MQNLPAPAFTKGLMLKMKSSFLIFLAMISVLTPQAKAETKKKPTNSAQNSPLSWMFVLETKTQWAFVLEENHDNPMASSFATSGDTLNFPGREKISQRKSAQPQRGMTSATQNTGKNHVGDVPLSGVIFQGNTSDIPSDEPPKPLPGKSKPSSSSS